MAKVVIPVPVDGAATLPAIGVGCGRPASGTRRVRILRESYGYARMVGEYALDHMERMARGPGIVCLPVCRWHRWIVPPAVSATPAGVAIRLSGVSGDFVRAVGGGRRPG